MARRTIKNFARPPLLLLLFSLLFCFLFACAPRERDLLAPFRGDFVAEIEGEMRGEAFAALVVAKTVDAGRCVTVSFYAPTVLQNAVLTKEADGTLTLRQGDLTLSGDALVGFLPLFSLFDPSKEVKKVTLEGGQTTLSGDGFTLAFLGDGTPARAENAAVTVRVVSFSAP